MSVEINVVGLDLVRRNLKAVDHQLPRGLTKIHREVAEPVSKKAKPKVKSRTGALERSIKPSGTQRGAFVMAGRGLAYGAVNHYGGYPGDYPGNPFLTDTLAEESTESVHRYERLLGSFLESVWQDS